MTPHDETPDDARDDGLPDPGTTEPDERRSRSDSDLPVQGVTTGPNSDAENDPAAVAPWPPPGEEDEADRPSRARPDSDLPSKGVREGPNPNADTDPAAVAPWPPPGHDEDGPVAEGGASDA